MTLRTTALGLGFWSLFVSVSLSGACGGATTGGDPEGEGGGLTSAPIGGGGPASASRGAAGGDASGPTPDPDVDFENLTCGDWLEAVRTAAAERCQWTGVVFQGYDESRPLDARLAESVCYPALVERDCMAPDPEFTPEVCESACAL
ncbi:MAG: hypothetical protein JW751_27915 [Polyangiaceae bacterium]|nr:hypothetical protein [Polyangiaceae bacterium]